MKWFSCLRYYCSLKKKLRKESGRRRDKKKRRIPTQQAELENFFSQTVDLIHFHLLLLVIILVIFHPQLLFACTTLSCLFFNFPGLIHIIFLAFITFSKMISFVINSEGKRACLNFFFLFLDFFIGLIKEPIGLLILWKPCGCTYVCIYVWMSIEAYPLKFFSYVKY